MKFSIFSFLFVITLTNSFTQNYVKIGKTYWADHNLNTSSFSNGDPIAQAKNTEEWENFFNQKIPAYCSMYYNPKNDSVYGKVYNWWAVVDLRGLAPEGFMVPSLQDWMGLKAHLNYDTICKCYPPILRSADKLKSTTQWKGELKGDNLFNMNILPAGYVRNDGRFEGRGLQVSYWTCSPENAANNLGDSYSTYYMLFKHDNSDIKYDNNFDANGHFVRCAKGQQEYYFSVTNSTNSETPKESMDNDTIENSNENSDENESSDEDAEQPKKKKKRKKKS
jgi:uncharacterized protein (TIGR02145 family)